MANPALSAADDLLLHQLARPFSLVADPASNWFDRLYFNLHPAGPGPSLVIGAGRYANVGVMDGYLCLVHAGEQRSLRFARRVGPGEAPTEIGPLRWEVLEPLRRWRLVIDAPDDGVKLDAIWTARCPAYAVEPIAVEHADGPATDFSHFFQPGRYAGSLKIDGQSFDLDGWFGMRDRSWGVRRTRERLGMHLWGGAQLADRCVAVLYNEGRDHEPVHVDGAVMTDDGAPPVRVVAVQHDLQLDDGTELVDGVVALTLSDGERLDVEWTGLNRGLYMAAAGYDGWHGQDRGAAHVERERWPLDASRSPKTQAIALVNKLCACRVAGAAGTGIFELAISRSSSYAYRPTIGG